MNNTVDQVRKEAVRKLIDYLQNYDALKDTQFKQLEVIVTILRILFKENPNWDEISINKQLDGYIKAVEYTYKDVLNISLLKSLYQTED